MNFEELVFVDLETSGLDPEQHDIIQLSAKDVMSGDTLDLLLNFKLSNASKEALRINNYDEERWAEKAVSQRRGYIEFHSFLSKHAKQQRRNRKTGELYNIAVLAGHNLEKFDMRFLQNWEARMKSLIAGRLPMDYACYDTLQLARWLLPDKLEGYRLDDLISYFNIDMKRKSHDAQNDVEANIQVAAKLIDMLPCQNPFWVSEVLAPF